ncbi:GNAT family N-acetyltransferase [Sandaracinus amylolyticus]|uniref:Acetyltransferase n=1 Tax=Sandaracinus amylolyticus TaxID=927083 RepID=A0A0F6W044_9BACT|nr:GNAT family N-acetyltransferase [Sandaracinus amylolyticus]AKF04048.1 Acetyltransferase [Sandaracinus amylolyticus]
MLDNPTWSALTTEQSHLALRHEDAARFPPAVTTLAGARDEAALDALARALSPGEIVGVFAAGSLVRPRLLVEIDGAPLVQMVHELPAPEPASDVEILGASDVPAMLALAERTRPGPFGPRTVELGTFLGVRDVGGRLVAMAGQRLRLPGTIEISAVCTDPAHAGRGLAARLITEQLARIHGAGASAFLHVRADNARAIALYERLGFRTRRRFRYLVLRRADQA